MSNITYHSLHDYVGGQCITKTFELDGSTHEEHLTEISQWLTAVTKNKKDGELREEWIVCDYDDVPSNYVGEYSIDPAFFELMEAIDNSHYDAEVFNAGIALGLSLSDIENNYHGYFSNYVELAEMYVESGCIEIPEHLEAYFNYESYGRDLSYDFSEFDGHYFFNC
jgi:antirestriction protein